MAKSLSKQENQPRGRTRRGIQSVEVGGRLLQALAHHGLPMALKDLAADAGMTAAKAHPYLVSFGHIGLVEQERDSGRYALGPLALQMGLISLQQADPVRIAALLLPGLAANSRPDAVAAIENTVPCRMSTCTAAGDASRSTTVGPRLPHTTSATVWPVRAARPGNSSAATRTGSACCRLIRPICNANGPSA